MKIAIIGSGISGLISAYTLQKEHEITLFEANNYLGGHTNTLDVIRGDKSYAIDTGFIVFNNKTYPNFIKFLSKIGAQWKDTEMSFSVFDRTNDFEYNGNNLNTLFAQGRNLYSPKFYKFITEILRFNKLCKIMIDKGSVPQKTTFGEFLKANNFSTQFKDYYILPMAAAIWSSCYNDVENFELDFFIQFFSHHGLLNINDRPQWHVIRGGSREYIRSLMPHLNVDVRLNSPIACVQRSENIVGIRVAGQPIEEFDQVIFACHGDQALKMIEKPTDAEFEVLSQLKYQDNQVTLHTDTSLLPGRKRAWASWNYKILNDADRRYKKSSVSYNMNILQGIEANETFIVSLNLDGYIDESKIIRKINCTHPVFSGAAEHAKAQRKRICGTNRSHFCGAYWYSGFHEDGVRSALDVAKRFGVSL